MEYLQHGTQVSFPAVARARGTRAGNMHMDEEEVVGHTAGGASLLVFKGRVKSGCLVWVR